MRTALILLLVATNAFWLLRRVAEPPAQTAADSATEMASLRAREAGLRAEIEKFLPRAPSPPAPAGAAPTPRQAAPSRPREDWREILKRTPEAQRPRARADLIRRAFGEGAPGEALGEIGNSYVPGDAAFREAVLNCLGSGDEGVRYYALYALRRFPPGEDETARLLELSRDPEERVRGMSGALLVAHVQGPRGDESTGAVVRLLREPGRVSLDTVSYGLWDACPRYPVGLEEALLAAEGDLRSEIFVRAFRYMDPKSDRVLEALLRSLSAGDGRHAAEALRSGVPAPQHARVVEVALKLLATRRQGPQFPFDLLAQYGTAEDAATLERMVVEGTLDRIHVERTAAAIGRRAAGH